MTTMTDPAKRERAALDVLALLSESTNGGIAMTDSDHDWLAGAMADPEPQPRTYRLVESDNGACPECGRIDHRYLDYDSDGAQRVTRTCDEHRLIWTVAELAK